jgi:hypothetical protein
MDIRIAFASVATLAILSYIAYYVGLELWCYVYGLLY